MALAVMLTPLLPSLHPYRRGGGKKGRRGRGRGGKGRGGKGREGKGRGGKGRGGKGVIVKFTIRNWTKSFFVVGKAVFGGCHVATATIQCRRSSSRFILPSANWAILSFLLVKKSGTEPLLAVVIKNRFLHWPPLSIIGIVRQEQVNQSSKIEVDFNNKLF
jgi:hypothetical protein